MDYKTLLTIKGILLDYIDDLIDKREEEILTEYIKMYDDRIEEIKNIVKIIKQEKGYNYGK